MLGASGRSSPDIEWREPPNDSMQRPALRAAADAERWADATSDAEFATKRGAQPMRGMKTRAETIDEEDGPWG
jgi:hypothetical protein